MGSAVLTSGDGESDEAQERKEMAAIKIQSVMRGHAVRLWVGSSDDLAPTCMAEHIERDEEKKEDMFRTTTSLSSLVPEWQRSGSFQRLGSACEDGWDEPEGGMFLDEWVT